MSDPAEVEAVARVIHVQRDKKLPSEMIAEDVIAALDAVRGRDAEGEVHEDPQCWCTHRRSRHDRGEGQCWFCACQRFGATRPEPVRGRDATVERAERYEAHADTIREALKARLAWASLAPVTPQMREKQGQLGAALAALDAEKERNAPKEG